MKWQWCLLLTILATLPVHANPTYVIGVQNFSQYYPYSSYANRNYSGFNRELLDMFAKTQNYRFIYKPLPLKRLYHRFVDGAVDFKYPDSPKWSPEIKRKSKIFYSEPVVNYIDGVMVIDDNYGQSLNQLKYLGVVAGFTPYPYQSRISAGQIQVDECYKYDSLLMKVVSGRVDGGYANVAVAQFYLEQMGFQKGSVRFDDTLPHSKGTRHLSTIKYPEVIAEFNRFLVDHKEDVDALKASYGLE
ncbi:hypothetical protein BZG83_12695 [Salinivibrio sp. PR919]|nr:hypothetical protein BZG83_12695 [Salinivibrio sp. PR919]OOF15895.1 hypothetical protein BZG84_11350 [Salinivibrio sp. PR932]